MYDTALDALDACKHVLVVPLHRFGLIDLLKGGNPGARESNYSLNKELFPIKTIAKLELT